VQGFVVRVYRLWINLQTTRPQSKFDWAPRCKENYQDAPRRHSLSRTRGNPSINFGTFITLLAHHPLSLAISAMWIQSLCPFQCRRCEAALRSTRQTRAFAATLQFPTIPPSQNAENMFTGVVTLCHPHNIFISFRV
jgi:hypothetical protein